MVPLGVRELRRHTHPFGSSRTKSKQYRCNGEDTLAAKEVPMTSWELFCVFMSLGIMYGNRDDAADADSERSKCGFGFLGHLEELLNSAGNYWTQSYERIGSVKAIIKILEDRNCINKPINANN